MGNFWSIRIQKREGQTVIKHFLMAFVFLFSGCSDPDSRSASSLSYAQKYVLDLSIRIIDWNGIYPDQRYSTEALYKDIMPHQTERWELQELWIKDSQEGTTETLVIAKIYIDGITYWIKSQHTGSIQPNVSTSHKVPAEDSFSGLSRIKIYPRIHPIL